MSIGSFGGISVFQSEFQGGTGLRDLEKLLVDLLQGIDSLFELDVVGWELGLDGEYFSLCLDCRRKDLIAPYHRRCRSAP